MADVNPYRDEAASLLGQYLLKGYKMLDGHCQSCGTVLIQKRGGTKMCVLCQEILPRVLDEKSEQQPEADSSTVQTAKKDSKAPDVLTDKSVGEYDLSSLNHVRTVLLAQILSASRQLEEGSTSIVTANQLCNLITAAVNSLKALKDYDKLI